MKNRTVIIRTLGFFVIIGLAFAVLLAIFPLSVELPYSLEVLLVLFSYTPLAVLAAIIAAHGGADLVARIHVRLLLLYALVIFLIAGIQVTFALPFYLFLSIMLGLICFIHIRLAVVWLMNRSWWYVP